MFTVASFLQGEDEQGTAKKTKILILFMTSLFLYLPVSHLGPILFAPQLHVGIPFTKLHVSPLQ